MLDPKFVRENPDLIRAAIQKKCMEVDLDRILALDTERRQLTPKLDEARAEQNRASKSIGKLPPQERAGAAAKVKALKAEIKEWEERKRAIDAEFEDLMLRLPNPPADQVPEGANDADNVEIRRVGEVRKFSFEPKDHVALGEALGILDIERAGRIAGSRQYILLGDGCLLEQATLRFALDHMVERGFTPVQVPLLVRHDAMQGTAYFPGGEEQAYKMAKDELYLIGTSEVPLTSLYAGEILEQTMLPIKLVALSPCFRREAGTYGKDTRGLYRVHQFWKVEQVIIDRADEARSLAHHESILENSETLMQSLRLPYRVINVCGGDLGQPQVQKFDIETWMPSRGSYGETHSASRFHEFQARRLILRYRDAGGKIHYCHTLNNTVVASPRILIAILENYQTEDGGVEIPEVLRPYLHDRNVLSAHSR